MMVFRGRTVTLRPEFFYAEATEADNFQPATAGLVGVTPTMRLLRSGGEAAC